MAEDSELWDIFRDGPFVPMKTISKPAVIVLKTRNEYNDADRKAIEKNFRAKKILVCGIGLDGYNRISACQSAKEIWEALQTAHEGTTQVKQSKIHMLTTEYELFKMKDDESIQDMHTRFTSIINEIHSLGEIILRNKLVKKILSVLPGSWKSKVNAITEAKDLQKLTIDELIGNMKTYEIKKKKDYERRDPKKEKNLVLKADNNDSSGEDADMAYLTKRFQKMVRMNGGIPKGAAPASQEVMTCIINVGIQDTSSRTVLSSSKRFKRKDAADNVVKQDLATWEDSSSEFGEDAEQGDTSMMAVESELAEYDSIFALMANSNDDEDGDDDLVEHERDDLVAIVVDLKETIEVLQKEKDVLTEKNETVEYERDDLLVVFVDLKETIEELKRGNSSGNNQKGKEVAMRHTLSLKMNSLPCIQAMVGTCRESGSKRKGLPKIHIASMLLSLRTGFALTVTTLNTLYGVVG
ncbi:uncharacterized protein [Nicotiana tomentosiformis]|uniref:uncharacterized protein n=1 Tax=Nicotiana tomentosiformis TaxID=4098 RepID=UPI00388C4068